MSLKDWFHKLVATESQEDPTDLDVADLDDPFPDPVEIEITDIFDLHTIQPRDVKVVVEEYLYQARLKGFRSVRIIHGKGIGVQREMVRSILARTPFVQDWSDAPPEAGGLGATIVRMKF
ncbi:MAG TPA: Smr/MutS family protein [Pyrinomonadaceae bacterium]|nr:Smr/MutS family protein [Pyrinomonadaceae bacterium]